MSKKMENQLIENIVDKRNKLLSEAEEISKNIIKKAESEAIRIKNESEKQVEHVISSEIKAVHDRIVGLAKVEARKNMMLTREKIITDVFEKANKRLDKIVEDTELYYDVLIKLVIEAAKAIGEEELIVTTNSRDIKYLRDNLKNFNTILKENTNGSFTLSDKPIKIKGGIVVSNKNGDKVYINTLEGRLISLRNSKAAEIAKLLGVV